MDILNTQRQQNAAKSHGSRHRAIKRRHPRRSRKGIGLVGTFLSVAVGILIIVSTITIYRSVVDTYRISALTWQMTQMTGSLQRAYVNSPSYDNGSLIAVLDGGGDIPSAARRVASDGTISIVTPYGGSVTFTGDGGQNLTVTVNDLPQGACEKLLEGYVGVAAHASTLKSVTIGSSKVTIPLTRSSIATFCVEGGNNVVLTY